MNPREYQNLAGQTECDEEAASRRRSLYDVGAGKKLPPLLATRLSHAAFGLSTETGELTDALKKWLYYGQNLDTANIKEELGDCLWYIALACNALGFNMNEVMEANIAKLRQRYPEKYTDAQAAEENRDRRAEKKVLEETREVLEENKGGLRAAEVTAEETSGDSFSVDPSRFVPKEEADRKQLEGDRIHNLEDGEQDQFDQEQERERSKKLEEFRDELYR